MKKISFAVSLMSLLAGFNQASAKDLSLSDYATCRKVLGGDVLDWETSHATRGGIKGIYLFTSRLGHVDAYFYPNQRADYFSRATGSPVWRYRFKLNSGPDLCIEADDVNNYPEDCGSAKFKKAKTLAGGNANGPEVVSFYRDQTIDFMKRASIEQYQIDYGNWKTQPEANEHVFPQPDCGSVIAQLEKCRNGDEKIIEEIQSEEEALRKLDSGCNPPKIEDSSSDSPKKDSAPAQ